MYVSLSLSLSLSLSICICLYTYIYMVPPPPHVPTISLLVQVIVLSTQSPTKSCFRQVLDRALLYSRKVAKPERSQNIEKPIKAAHRKPKALEKPIKVAHKEPKTLEKTNKNDTQGAQNIGNSNKNDAQRAQNIGKTNKYDAQGAQNIGKTNKNHKNHDFQTISRRDTTIGRWFEKLWFLWFLLVFPMFSASKTRKHWKQQ